MKVCGIVCEYNPFHRGHLYQIDKAKELGATHIVSVMSGNVVQRGEAAIIDKHKRAYTACKNGADLVIELPCPFSCANAEIFALGAMKIMKGTGVVTHLSFGCETDDKELLEKAAKATGGLKNSALVRELIRQGRSYPSAVHEACKEIYGQDQARVISSPNNTLAIEYLRAAERIGFEPEIIPVKRVGAAHDSNICSEGYASASKLRDMIRKGEDVSKFIPYNYNYDGISDSEKFSSLAFMRFISMSKEEIADLPDSNQELAAKIKTLLEKGLPKSLEEFYMGLKTKNITHARIRRVVLYGVLGIKPSDFLLEPYARILAANKKGMEILAAAKSKSVIPISHSLSKLRSSGVDGRRLSELDVISSAFQKLCLRSYSSYPSEFSVPFTIVDS